MAKKNKNQAVPQNNANLRELDIEFSEEGVAEVNTKPVGSANRNKKGKNR